MKNTVTLPHLFAGNMLGGYAPQEWEALSMADRLVARFSFIEARARTIAEMPYDHANGMPANVHNEAAQLATKADQALSALDAEDTITAAWLAVEVGQHLERITTVLAVAKALKLTPKANRDDRRQEGTRKERRPEITEWIETQLTRQPAAKSPELWRIAPEWLTDQIGEDRFSKRVTAARKSLSGRK